MTCVTCHTSLLLIACIAFTSRRISRRVTRGQTRVHAGPVCPARRSARQGCCASSVQDSHTNHNSARHRCRCWHRKAAALRVRHAPAPLWFCDSCCSFPLCNFVASRDVSPVELCNILRSYTAARTVPSILDASLAADYCCFVVHVILKHHTSIPQPPTPNPPTLPPATLTLPPPPPGRGRNGRVSDVLHAH